MRAIKTNAMNNSIIKTTIFVFGLIFLNQLTASCESAELAENEKLQFIYSIPAEGNSWVINDWNKNGELIGKGGIKNWNETGTIIRTYFKVEQTGKLNLAILAKSVSGISTVKITCGNKTVETKVANVELDTVSIGIFEIKEKGYHFIEIQGIKKSGAYFPEIESILIGGEVTAGKVYFAKDDFYWGRRGPSVHLNFQMPENAGDVAYFYNEITVPDGNDILGSYFMANGFGQGYFGIQVNSETERRILFSVWSPFKTDNPGEIPEDQKIKLLKKGEGVYTGEFGNEGSGGQSYFKYMWKAGTTYRFLLKGKPTGTGETDFTAWFFAPEVGKWKLIASFRRPKTDVYLTRLHSFLENFYTETGNVTRKGNYSNQWIYNSQKNWIEITKMKFTADATARKESRMDYSGGAENQSFFLQNCGFFSETTTIDSYFERKATGIPPLINFEDLP
jgi:hypothetical protein